MAEILDTREHVDMSISPVGVSTQNIIESVHSEEDEKWSDFSCTEKLQRILMNTLKCLCAVGCLYFFICSLELLSTSFTLISGKSTSNLVDNKYINNPIVGLMIGILLTVFVQSSSTSTSIIVSMVASKILSVHEAIPIIMGSNIGTSVTNTIVSFVQITDIENFRRSFAGATVHDMFNWLCVLALLPLEELTGVLEITTGRMAKNLIGKNGAEFKFLEVITSPFTSLFIQIDQVILECWGLGFMLEEDSIIKKYCKTIEANGTDVFDSGNQSVNLFTSELRKDATVGSHLIPQSTYRRFNTPFGADLPVDEPSIITLINHPMYAMRVLGRRMLNFGDSPITLSSGETTTETQMPTKCQKNDTIVGVPNSCNFLFYDTGLEDGIVGAILLVISLTLLIGSLLGIVKILNSLMQGSVRRLIRRGINSNIPYVPWLTGYLAILVGALMTFLLQSSSVFTSSMTPLIGLGIITIERAYPLTLGSNVGTTTTTLLAALAVTGDKSASLQVALVHLLFNTFGIVLYYPIPVMRLPIPMAKTLGDITAKYRWFAILYLVAMFFLLPGFVFVLSLGGPCVLWGVLFPLIILILLASLITLCQRKKPSCLPTFLRTWDFLPEPLRSLDPYDKILTSVPCCSKFRGPSTKGEDTSIYIVPLEGR